MIAGRPCSPQRPEGGEAHLAVPETLTIEQNREEGMHALKGGRLRDVCFSRRERKSSLLRKTRKNSKHYPLQKRGNPTRPDPRRLTDRGRLAPGRGTCHHPARDQRPGRLDQPGVHLRSGHTLEGADAHQPPSYPWATANNPAIPTAYRTRTTSESMPIPSTRRRGRKISP